MYVIIRTLIFFLIFFLYRALSIIPCLLLLALLSSTWCLSSNADYGTRDDLTQLLYNKDDLAQLSDNKDDLAELSDYKDDLSEPSGYKDDSAQLSDYKDDSAQVSDHKDYEKLPSAMLRYQWYLSNHYDQKLHKVCGKGRAMFRVFSLHSNHHEDRRWQWGCKRVLPSRTREHCHWYQNVNDFDQPMFFMCGQNMYLKGIKSHHSNHHEDRRWSFYCCGSPGFITKSCFNTGYVNKWDGDLRFEVTHPGQVISGVYSYHNNHRE